MWLLLASKVQLCRNLQVEIVVNIARRDDMRLEILLTTCCDRPVNVMPDLLAGLSFTILLNLLLFEGALLPQIEQVLLEIGLHVVLNHDGILFLLRNH